jgi:hypothetical protein
MKKINEAYGKKISIESFKSEVENVFGVELVESDIEENDSFFGIDVSKWNSASYKKFTDNEKKIVLFVTNTVSDVEAIMFLKYEGNIYFIDGKSKDEFMKSLNDFYNEVYSSGDVESGEEGNNDVEEGSITTPSNLGFIHSDMGIVNPTKNIKKK